MNIIIGLLITIILLLVIVIIENFTVFQHAYTEKRYKAYFVDEKNIKNIVATIANRNDVENLTQTLERQYISSLTQYFNDFKKENISFLLDKNLLNEYYYDCSTEIHNIFSRKHKGLV